MRRAANAKIMAMPGNVAADQAGVEQGRVDREPDVPDSASLKRAADDDSDLESGEVNDDSDQGRTSTFPRKRAKLDSADVHPEFEGDNEVDQSDGSELWEDKIFKDSPSLSSDSSFHLYGEEDDEDEDDEGGEEEEEQEEVQREKDAKEDHVPPISALPKVSQGWNKGVSSGLRTSFGSSKTTGLPKPKQTTKTKTNASSVAKSSHTQAQVTNFYKSIAKPSKEEAHADSDSSPYSPADNSAEMDEPEPAAQSRQRRLGNMPFTLEERQKAESAIQALQHKTVKPFERDRHTWVLPAMTTNFQVGTSRFLNWSVKFEEWSRDFLGANKEHLRHSPAKLERWIWDAYNNYLDNLDLSKNFRKSIRANALDVRANGRLRDIIDTAVGTSQSSGLKAAKPSAVSDATKTAKPETAEAAPVFPVAQTVESQDVEMTKGHDEPTQQEHSLLHRYYPGIADGTEFCLTCATSGHREDSCPSMTCKFCQGAHFFNECPTRQRCEKCQQLGHTKSTCKEKLALAPGDEGFIECAFCQSTNHYEEKCTEIWRSYHPDLNNVRKVDRLPVFCYSCGQEGHYGGDCGVQVDRWDNNPKETWTKRSLNLYIDPHSTFVALVYENAAPAAAAPPDRPNIPGRSIVPQTHIFFDDSDDEADNNFIKAPVQRQQGPGQIRIASNIDFASQPNAAQNFNPPTGPADDPNTITLRNGKKKSNRRRPKGGGDVPVNPPLPPGPPPAPNAGFAPLPPRPASYQNSNSNANRGRPRRGQQFGNNNNQQQQRGSNYQGQGQGQGPPRGGGGSNRGRGGFSIALGSGGQRPRRGGRT